MAGELALARLMGVMAQALPTQVEPKENDYEDALGSGTQPAADKPAKDAGDGTTKPTGPKIPSTSTSYENVIGISYSGFGQRCIEAAKMDSNATGQGLHQFDIGYGLRFPIGKRFKLGFDGGINLTLAEQVKEYGEIVVDRELLFGLFVDGVVEAAIVSNWLYIEGGLKLWGFVTNPSTHASDNGDDATLLFIAPFAGLQAQIPLDGATLAVSLDYQYDFMPITEYTTSDDMTQGAQLGGPLGGSNVYLKLEARF